MHVRVMHHLLQIAHGGDWQLERCQQVYKFRLGLVNSPGGNQIIYILHAQTALRHCLKALIGCQRSAP